MLALVMTPIVGASVSVAFGVAAVAGVVVFVALAIMTIPFYLRVQAALHVLYPHAPGRHQAGARLTAWSCLTRSESGLTVASKN